MLWVIHRQEEHYEERGKELSRMTLVSVHRFQTGDAAMKRFGWTPTHLGYAETEEGATFIGDKGLRHTFTTAHAMPERAMMAAENGFKLVLHQVRDGQDYIKEFAVPPGREEIMTAVEYDAMAV